MTGNIGPIGGLIAANLIGGLLPFLIERFLAPQPPKPAPTAPSPYPPEPPKPGTPAAEFENLTAGALRLPTAAVMADVERALNEVQQQLSQRGITGPAAASTMGEMRHKLGIEATRAQADLARRAADVAATYASLTGYLPGGSAALPLYEFLAQEAMRRAQITGFYEPPFDLPGATPADKWRQYMRQREFFDLLSNLSGNALNQLTAWQLLNMFKK